MSAVLTPDDVARLAKLAHLELDAREVADITRQLTDFLAYAQQVQQIPVDGVPPTTHVMTPRASLRADAPHESLDRQDALGNAPDPDMNAGLFRVPRVIG